MSLDYYYRALCFKAGHGGVAKEGELKLILTRSPVALPNIEEIEFLEVHRGIVAGEAFVRKEGEERRPPTDSEFVALRKWCSGLLRGAMREANKPPAVRERRRR